MGKNHTASINVPTGDSLIIIGENMSYDGIDGPAVIRIKEGKKSEVIPVFAHLTAQQ